MPQLNVSVIVARVSTRPLLKRSKPVIKATIEKFGKRAMSIVGTDNPFNMANPRVNSYIKKWGAKKITNINNTTRGRLATVLLKAVENGDTTEQIAKTIGSVFDVAEGSRALMIARTEIAGASNFASHEGYKQAGIEQKEWQSTQDELVRETHQALDGQVQDINDPFQSESGATAQYPGGFGVPEEDINCRCGVLPRVSEKRLRGGRKWMWKMLELDRLPFDRKMRQAMKDGFKEQRKAVMAAFRAQVGE